MKIIGITGGVGAGKSAVLAYLEEAFAARVIQADEAGHLVTEPGTAAYAEIISVFGSGILGEDSRIDRRRLGAIVFGDGEKLQELNRIIHPAVKAWIRREIEKERREGRKGLLVIEAALLIEDHYEEICQELWYVYADPETRRERLKASRGYSEKKISDIFANQLSDEAFRRHCPVVIDNSGDFEETKRQTAAAAERLLSEAEE